MEKIKEMEIIEVGETTYSYLRPLSHMFTQMYGNKVSDSELIKLYESDKELTLSYIYCKNCSLFLQTASKFSGSTRDQQESFIIECIDKAIKNFEFEKGAKLVTYINKYVKNRAREEYSRSKKLSIAALDSSTRFESVQASEDNNSANFMDACCGGQEESGYETFEVKQALSSLGLSDVEMHYCSLILEEGVLNDTEAGRLMSMSSNGVRAIRERLQSKIGPMLQGKAVMIKQSQAEKDGAIKVKAQKGKLSPETKFNIAQEILEGKWKSRNEAAKYYGVDSATIGDVFSPKYCPKAIREKMDELISKIGSKELQVKWSLQ